MTLDRKLSWSEQIDNNVNKMGRGVLVVRIVLKIMPPDIIRQDLNALVLSQLDYFIST